MGGYDLVGINATKVDGMQQAIRTYVDNINAKIDELENCDPSKAFKGSAIVASQKAYIEAVKEAAHALTSRLLMFNTKLGEIKAAYIAKDSANATTVDSNATTMRSTYTTYTEGAPTGGTAPGAE